MTIEEYVALGWWAQRRPRHLTALWQGFATEWYRLGEHARGDLCQRMADWFAQPMWRQLFAQDTVAAIESELRALREKETR